MESDADDVTVEFDPRFRYPVRIRIDRWRDAIEGQQGRRSEDRQLLVGAEHFH